jgi:hypothetical protein
MLVFKVMIIKRSLECELVIAKWCFISEAARERKQNFAHVRHHPSKEEI